MNEPQGGAQAVPPAADKTVSGADANITAQTPEKDRTLSNLTITDKKMTVTDTPVTINQALTIGGEQGSQNAALVVSGQNASVTASGASTISNPQAPAEGAVRQPQLLIDNNASGIFKDSLTATNSTMKVESGGKMHVGSQGMTLNGSTLQLESGGQLSGIGETMTPVTISGTTTVDLSGGAVAKVKKITAQNGSTTTLNVRDGSQLEVGKTSKLAPSVAGDAVAAQQAAPAAAMQLQTAKILVDGKTSVLSTAGLSVGANSLITLSNGGTLKSENVKLSGANAQLTIGNKNAPGFLDPGSSVDFDATNAATQKLIFNHSDTSGNYEFAAKITGAGAVESAGGTTTLLGQTITGTTTVTGGSTLILEKAKLATTMINAGTLIYRSGSLGNTTIDKNGLLSLGSKPVNVTGTFTMKPDGQLFVAMDGSTDPKVAAVTATGAADITNARLTVEAKPGLTTGTPYAVVQGSSLTGKFQHFGIINNAPYLTGKMGYDDKKAFVTWTKVGSFSDVSTEPSAKAAGKAMDSLPSTDPLYQHMLTQPSPAAATAALQTISGDSVASVTSALQNVAVTGQSTQVPMRYLRQNMAATMRPGAPLAQSGGSMPMSALPSSTEMPLWAEVVGNWQRDNGSSQAPGLRANTTGLFIGGDHAVNRDWRMGAALGYTHTKVNVNARNAHADVDNYSLSLYGGRSWMTGASRLNLMFGTAYTWHEIDSRRNMAAAGLQQAATARHGASTLQLFSELGYAMPLSNAVNIEPYLGLSWNKQDLRAYNEKGSIAALSVQSQSNTTVTTTLGLRTRYQFDLAGKPAALRASLGWRYLAGDLTAKNSVNFSGGQPFGVRGNTLARSNALLEVGGDVRINDSSMLSLTYGGEFGAGTQQHQVSAVARWSF